MKKTPCRNVALLACLMMQGVAGTAWGADEAPRRPRPVIAWPAGPFEVRVAFDAPIDASIAEAAVGRTIPFEEASVTRQAKAGAGEAGPGRIGPARQRGALRIAAARLEDGGRSLRLVTDPHPRVANYSLRLDGIRAAGRPGPGESIDLTYGLGGVEATWDEGNDDGSGPTWSGWWPDLDPAIVHELTRGSVEHERSLALLSRPGRLVLSTLIAPQGGNLTLRLASNAPIEAVINGEEVAAVAGPDGSQQVDLPVQSTGEPIDLMLTLRTGTAAGKKPTTLRAALIQEGAPRESRLARERLLVPWAALTPPPPAEPPTLPPGLVGGDPARGERIFFGEQARCSACHAIGGKGGNVGPELGQQSGRPPAEVYRDVVEPGAWINPEFVAYTVATKDGRILVGIVRAEGAESIRVTDTDARTTLVNRSEIDEFRPSPTSIMPVGLAGTIGDGPLRDLLAFLTQPPATSPQ